MKDKLKELGIILIVILLQSTILFVNYHNCNINYPLYYTNGDDMGVFYYSKSIDEFSINLENSYTGGYSGTVMYDYPYSDSLSFLLVKIIGFTTDNPFLIINIFYFLCSIITVVISYIVITKYLSKKPISIVLALLYANSFFYQLRYGHMWLIPYFTLPIACSLAIDIINGDLIVGEVKLWKNKSFYKAMLMAFSCAFTGLYYAYFTCALLAIAMVICLIQQKKIKGNMYPVILIGSVIFGIIIQVIKNFVYWQANGYNQSGELAIRNSSDSELYGMKLIQLILPRVEHRIGVFAQLAEKYHSTYPLVNENTTASMGVIASIGLIIALIQLFSKRENKTYAYLIIATLLVATIGGIGSIISIIVNVPVRCYNRMSLVIMFLCLLCFGEVFESILSRCSNVLICIVSGVLLFIGVFDQTKTVVQDASIYTTIDNQRDFVKEVEEQLDDEDYVFELPYVNWPSGGNYRMFVGYLFSDDIHWSYGAMQGREEALWQQKVASKKTSKMVDELEKKGYNGIYVDVAAYEGINGEKSFQTLYENLNKKLDQDPLVSSDGSLYFWNIGD